MDINQDSKAKVKSSMKMNVGLGSTKLKSDESDQLEGLKPELCEAHHDLLYSLRAEVDQKERIATLAVRVS